MSLFNTNLDLPASKRMVTFSTDKIMINIWKHVPQVEIYTRRGQSFVVKGDEALELAQLLNEHLVKPLLNQN